MKKVVFDEGETPRVIGVRYVRDGEEFVVGVRKEAVVSGGSINTPQILMLSGIGDKQHLHDHGVTFCIKCTIFVSFKFCLYLMKGFWSMLKLIRDDLISSIYITKFKN